MRFLLAGVEWADIFVVFAVLLVLAVAGMITYAAARQKRRKMQHFTDIFEMGDDNFTPEEIRMAVEHDKMRKEETQEKR